MKRDLTAAQLAQEVTVTLPLSVVIALGATPVQLYERPIAISSSLPKIGEAYGGGVFVGVTVHDNQPMALVLLPGDEKKNWKEANSWAEEKGGVLPSRIDQLVLFQNLKSEFQEAWYWSSTQSAGYDAYAWVQYFGYGNRHHGHKDNAFRCRAVRRLPIQ